MASVFKASPSLVLQSVSTNIYENLALEDWIHDHLDPQSNPHVLLLSRNSPCAVVGRHQNPWQECDLKVGTVEGIAGIKVLSTGY